MNWNRLRKEICQVERSLVHFRLLTAAALGLQSLLEHVQKSDGAPRSGDEGRSQPVGPGSTPPTQQQLSKEQTGETLPVCCLC